MRKGKKQHYFCMQLQNSGVIVDSYIQADTLKRLNKDKQWLNNILIKKNIKLEDIFYAFYKDNNLFIIKHKDLL